MKDFLKTPRRLLPAWLALSLGPWLGAANFRELAPEFTRIGAPVSVPAEVSDHAMYVNVMVNGRGPFRMFVDTGCSVTLISPELAEAVDAIIPDPTEGPVLGRNGFGDTTGLDRVLLESVQLGGVRFEGVTAGVSDSLGALSAIGGRRVDGLLGFPVFADLFVALDFPRRRLLLSDHWPEGIPPIRAEVSVIERSDVPFLPVRIQGILMEVMVDTGSNQDLQLPFGLVPALNWKDEPRPGSLVAVIGETGRESIGRLTGTLKLGSVRQGWSLPRSCRAARPALACACWRISASFSMNPRT